MDTIKIARLAAAPTALLLAVLLAGCGGSGSKGPAAGMEAAIGAVQFHLKLPAAPAQGQVRPALIPQDFQSLVITLKDGDKIISGPTVTTKAVLAQNGGLVQIGSLPLKALTALVEAKADPNGQGAAEAAASETVTPTAGTPATAPTLILQSRIVKLAITTPSVALLIGGAAFLSATPTDQDGQVVMVDPNTKTIQWTAPSGVTLDTPIGLTVKLTGAAAGSGPISAVYTDGTPATGDFVTLTSNAVPITVTPKPTGLAPNIAQYFQQVAIGPTGSGPGSFQSLKDVALGSVYTADPLNTGFEVQKFVRQPDGSFGAFTTLPSGGQGPSPGLTISVSNASSVAVAPGDGVYVIGDYTDPSPSFSTVTPGTVFRFNSTGDPVDGSGNVTPLDANRRPTPYLPNVSNARGVAVDSQGNLFVAEAVAATGSTQIEVFSSTGIASLQTPLLQPGLPAGLTVDPADNVYVLAGSSLVKFKPNTAADPTQGYALDAGFGNGGVTVPLVTPARVAVDTRPGLPTTGNVYVTLPQNNQVEVFDRNGNDSGKLPLDVPLNIPTGIAIDNSVGTPSSGYLYIGNGAVPSTGNAGVDQAVHVYKPQP